MHVPVSTLESHLMEGDSFFFLVKNNIEEYVMSDFPKGTEKCRWESEGSRGTAVEWKI